VNGSELATQLASGLHQLGLALPAEQQQALLAYLDLLNTWNQRYNLTAIRDPLAMVSRHLLDALVALPWVRRGPVLDVGSGAGLPGLPLAIARPELEFTLLDSNGKKVRFIKQVVISLQLTNVDVVQSRVESFRPMRPYALIVSRAFASLTEFIRLSRHLLDPVSGEWLAWKAALTPVELQALDGLAQIREQIPVNLPGIAAPRQLVRLQPAPAA